jgi:hypothetical protein
MQEKIRKGKDIVNAAQSWNDIGTFIDKNVLKLEA